MYMTLVLDYAAICPVPERNADRSGSSDMPSIHGREKDMAGKISKSRVSNN